VQAWGLDPDLFGGRPVTNAPIEAAVGGRPAFVRLFDAHSALATDRALAIAGVTGPRRCGPPSCATCSKTWRPPGSPAAT
jgi:predicted amidohydrolase YtcJ